MCIFVYGNADCTTKNQRTINCLKGVIKALKIDFKSEKSPYEPEFEKMILQGMEDIKNGNGVKIDTKDLWK